MVRPRPSCQNISAGIGDCHVTVRLVARRWFYHKLTFGLVGKCNCASFESRSAACNCRNAAAVLCTGGSRRQLYLYLRVRYPHQSQMFSSPISLFGVPATTTASAGPWWMTAWSGSILPVTAEPSVYPSFSRTKFGRSAVLLVSPDWSLMTSSSISILRCRPAALFSGRRCVLLAHYWNIHNSRAGASTSWSFSEKTSS